MIQRHVLSFARPGHGPSAAGALLLSVFLAGCHRAPEAPGAAASLPTAPVRTQTVSAAKQTAFEEVVGTIRPRLHASLEAKVSGRIEQLDVRLGQVVQDGEILAALDVREIQAKLDQAQAVREQAKRDLERYTTLLGQQAVTQAEFDAVEARERVAEAAVLEAQTMLDYAQVRAPFDGVITRKMADVGDLAGPGRPILQIEDPTRLQIEADVPEALLNRIATDATLRVRIPTASLSVDARVDEVSPSADPGSRTFRVKLDLPPTDGLRSGQFGRLLVPVQERTTFRVPKAAVTLRGQMEIAFVVTNGVARMRLVKTGRDFDQEIEVLSGLEADETIVVEGAETLRDGQPVATDGQG